MIDSWKVLFMLILPSRASHVGFPRIATWFSATSCMFLALNSQTKLYNHFQWSSNIIKILPPNAPPISAPLVGMLTLTMPQSDPFGPTHLNKFPMFCVNILLDNPWFTSLFHLMASSKFFPNTTLLWLRNSWHLQKLDDRFNYFAFKYIKYGRKCFMVNNFSVVSETSHDCRLDKVTLSVLDSPAATLNRSTLLLGLLYRFQVQVNWSLRMQGSVDGVRVERIANSELCVGLLQTLKHLIVDILMNDLKFN